MPNKHLFFDLDRTLWDFEKNSENALKQLFKETVLNQRVESFERFHRVYKNENALLWKKYGNGIIDKDYLRNARFENTLLRFDVNDKQLVEDLSNGYVNLSPYQTALLPNAHESLRYLKKLGYAMHIITNGFKEVQHIKLEKCELSQYFDVVLCSEEVGVNKPHPEIFAHALNTAGAKASESAMIGDDYEIDVLGALRFGMHAIHFDPKKKRTASNGDWRIRDLNQLAGVLPWIFK